MYRLLIMFMLLISGCTTTLWVPEYEEEYVTGFYVNKETKQLFVTTDDTAYVFPIESDFGEALLLSRSTEFSPWFQEFEVSKTNEVTGKVILTLIEKQPSHELISKLESIGFKKDDLVNSHQLTKEIKGKRYIIQGELPLEKLEKKRSVMVAQPSNYTETAGKIIATPATITFDAIVTVPAAFLAATLMALGSP